MKNFEEKQRDLKNQLNKLEEEREEFERLMIKSQELCDQQGESAMRRFYIMEEIRLNSRDPELLKVLSYNHEVMSSMKKNNEQLYHSCREVQKKKQREWSMREEDAYLELQKLQQEKDDTLGAS